MMKKLKYASSLLTPIIGFLLTPIIGFVFWAALLTGGSTPLINDNQTPAEHDAGIRLGTICVIGLFACFYLVLVRLPWVIEGVILDKKQKKIEQEHNLKIVEDLVLNSPVLVRSKLNSTIKYVIITPEYNEKRKVTGYQVHEMVMKKGGYLPEEDENLQSYNTNFLGTFNK